ncbi:MAG: hypothetical protein ACR2QM_01865, partial [Longimicrobiales bacterium]
MFASRARGARRIMLVCTAVALGLSSLPEAAAGQFISIRTAPISQAHQFQFLPSMSLAMGGVGIAVRDPLLDPFVNPAKATRSESPYFFSSPGVYDVSQGAGGGRTLPAGGHFRMGTWYGALALSLQEVDPSEQNQFVPQPFGCPTCGPLGLDPVSANRPKGNEFVKASLARPLPWDGLSIGGSASWSGLEAVDGVDLLYAGSSQIDQFGGALDLRMGLLKEWDERHSFEVLALHNRVRMTHDVFYLDSFWDPGNQRVIQQPRLEENLDHTDTWGIHAAYERPLDAPGWTIGWSGTFNYKAHPKIPNYEIQNIPRDPGFSRAYNIGMGLGKRSGSTTFGMDVIYEPIWSHTWADSETPVTDANGQIIAPGGKTIENRFRFSNALLRMGVGEEFTLDGPGTRLGLQAGLNVKRHHYTLDQRNHVQLSARGLEERWTEWSP